jgi:hypothetical protein
MTNEHLGLPTFLVHLLRDGHYRNDRFGLIDCTNRGFYHNRQFRDSAILPGLICAERLQAYGYGMTRLGERAQWAISRLHPKASLFCVGNSHQVEPR